MSLSHTTIDRLLLPASLLGLVFIMPHTIEDFLYHVPEDRFSLDQTVALWGAGVLLALQVLALVLLGARRRAGVALTGLVGAGWVLAALLDHTGDVLSQPFREGFSSTVWVLGIVVTQAVVAAAAAGVLYAERRERRGGGSVPS